MSEESEITQYFMEHPDQYAVIKDDKLIEFLERLLQQALSEDEINFLYKQNAKKIMKNALDLQFIEKIMVAGKARYFVTQTAKIFLQERAKLRKSYGIFNS